MDLAQAARVLSQLASGRDPTSGDLLPQAGPYDDPLVIRSLFAVLCHLRESGITPAQKAETEGPNPARQQHQTQRLGAAWTPDEDEKLIDEFEAAVQFEDIALAHGRPCWAVIRRLKDLGKIQSKSARHQKAIHSTVSTPKPKRPQAGKLWRPDEDTELLKLFDEGVPLAEIAERLGRGLHAVDVRLFKLGRTAHEEAEGF